MPPDADFQANLVAGVLAAVERARNPFALHDVIILAPTRRAVRSLSEGFLQHSGGKPAMLLPRIIPIGDVDADEPPFLIGDPSLSVSPAIAPARRIFALMQLVQAKAKAGGQGLPMASALAEAQAVAGFLDSAAHERVTDFAPAREGFAQYLANAPEHVQRAARFLEIVGDAWPVYLSDNQLLDPAERSARMLEALSDAWTQNPPKGIVIAAGSTGSQPATARLLKLVAGLEQGAVLLPGLDMELPVENWKEVLHSPQHPQFSMARLLHAWKMDREQVQTWPEAQSQRAGETRRRVINEALKPAETTHDWVDRLVRISRDYETDPAGLLKQAFSGLSIIEADTEEEEAQALALAIRHQLQNKTANAALITPDRALARRVQAQLQRFNIAVDDSAGLPLMEDPVGTYLSLIWRWWADPGDPQGLLALLHHDLCACGMPRAELQGLARLLDKHALRGVRQHDDLASLAEKLPDDIPERPALVALLVRLHEWASKHEAAHGVPDWARAHAHLAETMAGTDESPGAARLWQGRSGEAAANLFRSLMDDGDLSGDVDASGYWAVYEFFAGQVAVRRADPKGGRVRILGPLEARMQSADLILLGGLNEEVWPSPAQTNPFLPRSLLTHLGLPDPEQRIGLSAHDFAMSACKPNVIVTRSKRKDGKPAVASRWLWRLQTLAKAADHKGSETFWQPETDYLMLARMLNETGPANPAPEPKPCPPVPARPKSLYVTRIEKLIRNPYAIYGQKILRLSRMDPVGGEANAPERGNAYHKALEYWKKQQMQTGELGAADELYQLMCTQLRQAGFTSAQMAVERIRARQAVNRIVDYEQELVAQCVQPVLLEDTGHWSFTLAGGEEISISAKVDRVDRGVGGYLVRDYKTATSPGKKEVAAGFAPQLPLTALILEKGGFPSVKADGANVVGMTYLKTGVKGDQLMQVELTQGHYQLVLPDAMKQAEAQVHALFADFNKSETPYLCQPRAKYKDSYSDYDHLARRAEWDSQIEGEGGDND